MKSLKLALLSSLIICSAQANELDAIVDAYAQEEQTPFSLDDILKSLPPEEVDLLIQEFFMITIPMRPDLFNGCSEQEISKRFIEYITTAEGAAAFYYFAFGYQACTAQNQLTPQNQPAMRTIAPTHNATSSWRSKIGYTALGAAIAYAYTCWK